MAESFSFKLYFLKADSQEVDFIKRVRVASSPTFKAFQTILSSLFPNKNNLSFTIQWKDEEGDMILVGSQPEWAEAVACCSSWPFKLYLHLEEVAEQQVEEEEEEDDEEEVPAFTVTPEGFYSELEGAAPPSIDEQRHLTETIPEIIEQLAGPYGCLPGWIMTAIGAKQEGGDVLLDVNIPRFSLALHSRALSLLVKADDEPHRQEMLDREAVGLLRHCVRLTPGDRNAHFNLSCGLSRLGETEQALAPLERYIELGGEVKLVYQDADLINIRNSISFVEFEQRNPNPLSFSSSSEEEVSSPPVVEEASAPVVEQEEAPVEEKNEEEEEKLKVLKEFGIEEEFGRLLLEDCDGDVEAIVAAQFQSQFL